MQTPAFSISDVLAEARRHLRGHFAFVTGGLTVCSLLPVPFLLWQGYLFFQQVQSGALLDALAEGRLPEEPFSPVFYAANLAGVTLNGFFLAGLYRGMLKAVRGEEPARADLFGEGKRFWRILGTMFLLQVGFDIGEQLLVVPMLILMVLWSQALFLVIDQDAGPLAALARSAALTRGARWRIFLFLAALAGINALGAALLLFGLLYTVPLSFMALAVLYEKLRLRADGAAAQ